MTVLPDQPPQIEPDASIHLLTGPPTAVEYGTHTFARDIARHVHTLLGGTISRLAVRENPWDRRPCPRASAYELTFTDRHHVPHTARVTAYDAARPLSGTLTEYALILDDTPIAFERESYQNIPWQLARAIWIAAMDQRIVAERAAEHSRGSLPHTGRS